MWVNVTFEEVLIQNLQVSIKDGTKLFAMHFQQHELNKIAQSQPQLFF